MSVNKKSVINPGATIGILGSGQLGRMLSIAAQSMGYRVHIFSPDKDSPAEQVSSAVTHAKYSDLKALQSFAKSCDLVTIEFENIPAEALQAVADHAPVQPSQDVLKTFQHRIREKTFLLDAAIPCAAFRLIENKDQLEKAVQEIGLPAVLKTAGFGYDGKGQKKLLTIQDVKSAIENWPQMECVLEAFVEFEREISIVAARSSNGEFSSWEVIENLHTNHILDISSVPAKLNERSRLKAFEIAKKIADLKKIVGVFCVEFFLSKDGEVLVNEVAPRVHNSGHLTIESSLTSQFEQHIRAICGLSLGSTQTLQATAMANLLGDEWEKGEPNWQAALSIPGVSLHLYGKQQAKKARKMGHLTVRSSSADEAVKTAGMARAALTKINDI